MTGARTTLNFLHTGNPTGLKFLVEHSGARCLFDFGLEHAPGRAAFSAGLQPRPGRELDDLLAVGAAPRLAGVYEGEEWDGRTHIFISHLHLDHTALVRYLGPRVPLHFPEAMEPVRAAAADSGYLGWRRPPGTPVPDGAVVRVGEIEVRFTAVDHDVPGSTGFVVSTPDATIAFTGDTRWHGLHPELNERFVERARGADLLIQEGVSLGQVPTSASPPQMTEAEVISGIAEAVGEAAGLVIVNCYGMNRERVAGIAEGCAQAGRRFLMEPQMAAMAGWPGVLGDLGPVIADPRGHCLQLGFENLPLLIDLMPPRGSLYIHSGGAPLGVYDPAFPVMEAWVHRFGLAFRAINTSGHSRVDDIVRMVRAVAPGVVAPVHSKAPEALAVPGIPSFVPRAGVSYRVADILSGVTTAPNS